MRQAQDLSSCRLRKPIHVVIFWWIIASCLWVAIPAWSGPGVEPCVAFIHPQPRESPEEWALCIRVNETEVRCLSPFEGLKDSRTLKPWKEQDNLFVKSPEIFRSWSVVQVAPGPGLATRMGEEIEKLANQGCVTKPLLSQPEALADARVRSRKARVERGREIGIGEQELSSGYGAVRDGETTVPMTRWVLDLSLGLLLLIPLVLAGLTFKMAGIIPLRIYGKRDAERILSQCSRLLDEWLSKNKEAPVDSAALSLEQKIEFLIDRLQGLKNEMQRICGAGDGTSLSALHSQISSALAGAEGKPATLQGIVRDLKAQKAVRDALDAGGLGKGEGEDAIIWSQRVATRLQGAATVARLLRENEVKSLTSLFSTMKSLLEEASKLDSAAVDAFANRKKDLEAQTSELTELLTECHVSRQAGPLAVTTAWHAKVQQLAEATKKLEDSTKEVRKHQKKLEDIGSAFPSSRKPSDEDIPKAIRDYFEAQDKLEKLLEGWSGEAEPYGMAAEVVRHLNEIEASLGRSSKSQSSKASWEKRWVDLKSAFDELKILQAAEATIQSYLGLEGENDSIAVLRREVRLPHRCLRLRLSGVLGDDPSPDSPAERELFKALKIAECMQNSRTFLKRLAGLPDKDSLWSMGLSLAFSQNWLHDLLRASLVLETFYLNSRVYLKFRQIIALAQIFRDTLEELGKPLRSVRLLAPPKAGWTLAGKNSELSRFPDVTREVRSTQKSSGDSFVVDIERFGVENDDHFDEVRVILFNPSAWHESQGE